MLSRTINCLSIAFLSLAIVWISFILRTFYLSTGNSSGKMVQKFIYPEARYDESVVEDHFGTKVFEAFVFNRQRIENNKFCTLKNGNAGCRSVSLA